MSYKIPKIRKAFPFQRPLARQMNAIAELVNRGLVVDSQDIQGRRQQDGRVRLIGGGGAPFIAAATVSSGGGTPLPEVPGTWTELYCQSGGSNLNGGSDNSNTAKYTSTNASWNQGTFVFTPTDGSNPVSAGVAVGDFASIYLDGATVGVFIARITAVVNAANGAITVSFSANAGASPGTLATGRTIKVGGAWKGPNGASGFPLTLTPGINRLQNVAGDLARLNLKNDATYSVSATIGSQLGTMMAQGYATAPGDGGKATLDIGAIDNVILQTAAGNAFYTDLIFSTSATTGSSNLVIDALRSNWFRCIFHGARQAGLILSGGSATECEAYNCNRSNTAGVGGFVQGSVGGSLIRCYSHNHIGSNADGFVIQSLSYLINCIADTCGGKGLRTTSFSGLLFINNSDFYNGSSDAISIPSGNSAMVFIENCNFIKNAGAGINNASAAFGFSFNCGYGSESMANGASDTLGKIQKSGSITYPADTTPWTAPTTGNFTVNGAPAIGTGRGVFIETGNSKTGTLGTPNIGAA
jgi:hypothetical protein